MVSVFEYIIRYHESNLQLSMPHLYKHVLIDILSNEHSLEENIKRRFKEDGVSCANEK